MRRPELPRQRSDNPVAALGLLKEAVDLTWQRVVSPRSIWPGACLNEGADRLMQCPSAHMEPGEPANPEDPLTVVAQRVRPETRAAAGPGPGARSRVRDPSAYTLQGLPVLMQTDPIASPTLTA